MVRIVLTTTDSETNAREIALRAVQEGKAACVNIIRNVTSVYVWNGKLEEQHEFMLLCKTDDGRLAELESLIEELHTYEVPEIIEVNVEGGSEKYFQWIRESCRKPE